MASALRLQHPWWLKALFWATVVLAPGGLLLLPALFLSRRRLPELSVPAGAERVLPGRGKSG